MTSKALVGVDSGGTRTNVTIQILDNGEITRSINYEVGESLSGSLAPSLIPSVLRKILAPVTVHLETLTAVGVPTYLWISAAGFSPRTRDDYVSVIDELIPSVLNGSVRRVGVGNDAVSLLVGYRADGIIIAGTGSNVLVRSSDGMISQVGGHEWVASDSGSGFWISLRAIRQAYKDYEAGIDSPLFQRFLEEYGIRPGDDRSLIARLRDLAISDANMKKDVARFAASVCGAAERGDVSAQNIVKLEAEDLADVTAGLLRRRFSTEELSQGIQLIQCGSVLGNEFYKASFESQIALRLSSGIEHRAEIKWELAETGGHAALQLAENIAEDPSELLSLSVAFRPAIINA